ncbi:hypothetical protein M9458_005790, partial [Cirrhinus mrigala]
EEKMTAARVRKCHNRKAATGCRVAAAPSCATSAGSLLTATTTSASTLARLVPPADTARSARCGRTLR